jgi:hypothetical protein
MNSQTTGRKELRTYNVPTETSVTRAFISYPALRKAMRERGYRTVKDIFAVATNAVTVNLGDTVTCVFEIPGQKVTVSYTNVGRYPETSHIRVVGHLGSPTSAAGSRVILSLGGRLLPAADRARWLEEWINQLSELTTRRARARMTISLMSTGIPKLAVTLRRSHADGKRTWLA